MRYTLIKHATISQPESLLEWFKQSDWLYKMKAVKNFKPSKFIFCKSLQTRIVRHVEFNTLAWSFLVSNTESESEMFSEIRPNRGSQKYASYFTWQVENKPFKAGVLWMNDSRIHQDMKIARNDSAVKLGCRDWCGLPLNASEGLSEEALFFHSKGGRFNSWGLIHCDDRRSPWWASRDRPQHYRSRSDTVMISMNFNSYAWLYF